MRVIGTGFGWIQTDSGRYDHDVVVFPDGRIENRYRMLKGSNHVLDSNEAVAVLQGTKATLVVGTGQYGAVEVSAAARAELGRIGARLRVSPTPQAVLEYNRLPEPKCAVFHVTC